MKALTISQPYASLIASGEKWVENRIWATHYRGPLAIHAGKGTQYLTKTELKAYPTGCVVAVADLVACESISVIEASNLESNKRKQLIPWSNRNWSEVARHQYTEGLFCWILENVRPMRHQLRWRGAQGIWDIHEPTVENALEGWIRVNDELPNELEAVETKVHGLSGCGSNRELKRIERVWFIPGTASRVQYTPTHWRAIR